MTLPSPSSSSSRHRPHHRHHRPRSVRSYARTLTLNRWHTQAEWQALDEIVTGESHWDPCAVYPSMHACTYRGSNSCGIPQANPCPASWQGRLFAARWAEVRWLIGYVAGRYGDPLAALAFHERNGWF